MSQYATTAINAAIALQATPSLSAKKAWEQEIAKTSFSSSSKAKCCPRVAFVGLCDVGCVTGVIGTLTPPPTKSNALYAYEGFLILSVMNVPITQRAGVSPKPKDLWIQVLKKLKIKNKVHNSQMDVVIGLWINGLI